MGRILCKKLFVAEVDRWLHADAVSTKISKILDILVQITGECDNLSDEEVSDDE